MTVTEELAAVAAIPLGRAAIVLAATAIVTSLVLWHVVATLRAQRDEYGAALDKALDHVERLLDETTREGPKE